MHYYSFSTYLKDRYGVKVRRISLDAGFTCPNKDGSTGEGGCIFCNELGFSPYAGKDIDLDEQIRLSMSAAKEKGLGEKFIAYFQNATNTYAPCAKLKETYDVIKKYPDIVGLYISTRPDCVDDEKLDLVASYKNEYEVWVEYGVQTAHARTLEIINRGHNFTQSAIAIEKTAQRGIKVGAHVILGLPGESRQDMIKTAVELSKLPVSGIKLHVMHVLKGTKLEGMFRGGTVGDRHACPLRLMEADEYVSAVCDFLEHTRKNVVILRLVSDAREDVLVAPKWINNKLHIIDLINAEFERRGTWQGSGVIVSADYGVRSAEDGGTGSSFKL
jgi:radical SAM protein (TIGR01212 family)